MRLDAVEIQRFRNFVEPQESVIEGDVTCLIGKNESGKTTVLKALHRLNPANGYSHSFDLTTEYPRALLSDDRKKRKLSEVEPVRASFSLSEADCTTLADHFSVKPPVGSKVRAGRSYDGDLSIDVECDVSVIVSAAGNDVNAQPADIEVVAEAQSISDCVVECRRLSGELKASGEAARADAVSKLGQQLAKYSYLAADEIDDDQYEAISGLLPRFFYFSEYDILPGSVDLFRLAAKIEEDKPLKSSEGAVVALLAYANEAPRDFLDEDYDSRKAELQTAASSLTRKVFKYWRQNPDLQVVLDTDMPIVDHDAQGHEIRHRTLKIELRDNRHGGVETNFDTRSSGFQWFFSFLAAFSQYQDSADRVIVLLDEPATSLHGEAQKDFVKFIFDELGTSQQVLYTTHSQHMVDPTKYEKIRAVTDLATRDDPELGVVVKPLMLSADRETLLPVEAALGYSVSQHLFLGSGQHLAVEGSSDFIYLQRVSEYLFSQGKVGLDPRLSIIPVGGGENMPPFVALLGRRLRVTALLDGAQMSRTRSRVLAAAGSNGVPEANIVVCSQVQGIPTNADIEDLFTESDYLQLYSWAFTSLSSAELPETNEPILRKVEVVRGRFDHAQPAHVLSRRSEEFFATIDGESARRFEELFSLLNATVL